MLPRAAAWRSLLLKRHDWFTAGWLVIIVIILPWSIRGAFSERTGCRLPILQPRSAFTAMAVIMFVHVVGARFTRGC